MVMSGVSLIEKHPQLEKDVSLYKVVLLPLELYVLKYILKQMRPFNVREIYSESIFISWCSLFFLPNIPEEHKHISEALRSAGYGIGLIPEKDKEKLTEQYQKTLKSNLSETKQRDLMMEDIKKYHSKTPSYDKILYIIKTFERQGLVYLRGKEGKILLYAINPQFYLKIKPHIQEILDL